MQLTSSPNLVVENPGRSKITSIYRVVPFIVNIFLKTPQLLNFVMNFWYVTYFLKWLYMTIILQSFSKFWLFPATKRQICERTSIFFANFFVALVNFQVFVWDFPQEKLLSHQKAKMWGCWKKCLYCFVYCSTSNFGYYMEDKDLNYQVSTNGL